jgi:hypothetical protein
MRQIPWGMKPQPRPPIAPGTRLPVRNDPDDSDFAEKEVWNSRAFYFCNLSGVPHSCCPFLKSRGINKKSEADTSASLSEIP